MSSTRALHAKAKISERSGKGELSRLQVLEEELGALKEEKRKNEKQAAIHREKLARDAIKKKGVEIFVSFSVDLVLCFTSM